MDAAVSLARLRVPLGWVVGILAVILARPTPTLFFAGLGIAALGEALRLWASGHLEKNRTLTTSGPYRTTRNPLYFGSLFVGLGLALATGRLSFLPVVAVLFAAVYWPVMKREERRLARGFPETYPRYAVEVPLFLPRLRAGRESEIEGGRAFRWARVKENREHVTVLGWALVALLLGWRLWI